MGDTVVVGSCNGLVHGVDKAKGTPRWRYDASRDGGSPEFHGAPLVVGDLVILPAIRGIGYDGDLLFVGSLKGALFAVRPPRGGR